MEYDACGSVIVRVAERKMIQAGRDGLPAALVCKRQLLKMKEAPI